MDYTVAYKTYYDEMQSSEPYGDWSDHKDNYGFVIYAHDPKTTKWNEVSAILQNRFDNYEITHPIDPKEKIDLRKDVYLVYGIYESGDSFGRSTGNIEFFGITQNRKLAMELVKKLEQCKSHGVTIDIGNSAKVKFYVPWNGYFEHLTNIVVDLVDLKVIE